LDVEEAEARGLWRSCTTVLRDQVPEASWRTCFAGVEAIGVEDRRLVLAVPSVLVKERIERRWLGLLHETLVGMGGRVANIELQVRPLAGAEQLALADADVLDEAPRDQPRARPSEPEHPFNPRYTFEAFVIGGSNRFAHAAALAVAEAPARSYNPLFIHGAAGLGKTHLLHAIGNYVRQNFPQRHIRYVSTETFMNEFVDAIRSNTQPSFKRRYRECDVLLVDDIQFMEKKEGLQEEFFHTFNTLYGASRQIVITSDRPPKAIATLEDRLRSRFLSGLITDVQPPELETRLAILRTKATQDGMTAPGEVLEFIATHVHDNIRELEGALIRVCAYASLNRAPLTLDLAEEVLADIVSAHPRRITPVAILQATADTFGFTVEELCSASRRRPLVAARQIGMYVFRELTDFSYPAIGKEFGNRDHTTVMHAVEKISAQMAEHRETYNQVTELLLRIRGGG